ncbi:MAG: xanthine dehydrogenase family protein molybdopterin-binding subunit, partial [Bacteriovorax sp.]|nr:xanthine dehydrogenase family protein molybdopterin-binding subunit [Rhizobacter sp.]
MKFDQPATRNPIDRLKVVGKPYDRIDGPLKTTGTAPYAYERHDVVPNQAYGVILGAAIAKGRIRRLDTSAARAAPGVIAVVTHENAGKVNKAKAVTAKLMAGPDIDHFDQAVAIVVASTFEQARAATQLIVVEYDRLEGRFDLAKERASAVKPKMDDPPDTAVGNFAEAFANAPVKVDQTYTTPHQSHSAMEPFASIASWQDGKLTVWTSNQMIAWAQRDLAEVLGLQPADVRVVSSYVGGGFGSKLWIRSDVVMAALAARVAGRPVKVALARPQIPNNTTHRPATIQRIQLGAGNDGKLVAISHESWSGDLPGGQPETAAMQTRQLYAADNRITSHRLATLDLPEGNAMRAPGEAPGLMALEIAMDELAERLKMDPVALRIANDTQVDPEKPGRAFSHRDLIGCLRIGSERFGWDQRRATPGQVRDGRWLVGMGMASAFRGNITMNSAARASLDGKGVVTISTDMTDIGTGSYTIIAQTAAEMLGVPLEQVVVRLGDSDFPVSAGSGGQWGGNSSTTGVYAACMKLREAIARKAALMAGDARFDEGKIISGSRSVTLAEVAGRQGITVEDGIEF